MVKSIMASMHYGRVASLLAACVLTAAVAAGADPTLAVQSVSFTGGLTVLNDTVGGPSPFPPVATPQWSGGTQTGPVAYVSGTQMSVNVTFTITNPPTANTTVLVAGSNATVGQQTIEGTLMPSQAALTMALTFPKAFAATQTFVDNNFQIAWTYRLKNAGAPPSAGTTTHTVYATLKAPLTGTTIYRSTLALAIPAGGDTTTDAAFIRTWGSFSGPANVTTWNRNPLYYYQPGTGFGTVCSPDALLRAANGSGQCGAFAQLFQFSLAINGISSQAIMVTATDGRSLMVQDWLPVAPGGGLPANCETPPGFPTIQFNATFAEMVPSPNGAKSPATYCDYISQRGIGGQNTETPSEKVFSQHFIIMYTKTSQDCTMSDCYYDPSYGVTFRNAAGFQTNAIYGFVQQLPGMSGLYGRVTPQNPMMINIKFTPFSF